MLQEMASARFVYDGDGGRVKKITAEATTVYVGQLYEITGGVITKHIFAGATRIASKDSNGKLYFYHSDHLGSSNIITNSAGEQVQLFEYMPYGLTCRDDGDGSYQLGYKYTGKELDAETGLYFYGARYYDASLGRFITSDPIGADIYFPQTLNRYAYGFNNPLRYVDPNGLWSIGFKLFGFGFNIGDEGISVSIPGITLGYNWENNTASISFGIELFELQAGDLHIGVGASIGYSYNFDSGTGCVFASVGAYAGVGGSYYGYGASWNSVSRDVDFGGDWTIYPGRSADYLKQKIEHFIINANKWQNTTFAEYELTWEKGREAVLKEVGQAVKDPYANNILCGRDVNAKGPPALHQEGSILSKFLNILPGLNSGAVFHDTFARQLVVNVKSLPLLYHL